MTRYASTFRTKQTYASETRHLVADCEVHDVGSLALRPAAAIRTARCGRTRIGYGNRYGVGSSDGGGRDCSGKLFPGHEHGGLSRAIPIDDGVVCKAAPINCQGEPRAPCSRVIGSKFSNGGNNSRLRCRRLRRAIAAPEEQRREAEHRN